MAKSNDRIEFTELISLNGALAKFSPTGRMFAVAYTNKIVIRSADSLEVSPRILEYFSRCYDSINLLNFNKYLIYYNNFIY